MYFFIALFLLFLVLLIPSDNRFLSYIKTVITILLLITLIILGFNMFMYTTARYKLVKKDIELENKPVTSAQPTTTTTTTIIPSNQSVTVSVPAPIPGANVVQYPVCVSGLNPPCYQYSTTSSPTTLTPVATTTPATTTASPSSTTTTLTPATTSSTK